MYFDKNSPVDLRDHVFSDFTRDKNHTIFLLFMTLVSKVWIGGNENNVVTNTLTDTHKLYTSYTYSVEIVFLTQHGLMSSYGDTEVNIGSDNGLLPGGTKPLPKPTLTYRHRCSVAFTWERFHKKSQTWSVMCNMITIRFYFTKITITFPRGQWVNKYSS